jgi:hypothetical protein
MGYMRCVSFRHTALVSNGVQVYPTKHGVNIKYMLSITGLLGVDLTTSLLHTDPRYHPFCWAPHAHVVLSYVRRKYASLKTKCEYYDR